MREAPKGQIPEHSGSLCPRGCSCPSALRGWGDAGSVRGHLVTPQAPSPAGTWRGRAFNSNHYPPCCCTWLFAASTEAAGRWQARDAGRARTNPAVNHQNPSLPTRTPNPSWGLGTCSPPALPATTGMSRYRPGTVFSFFFFISAVNKAAVIHPLLHPGLISKAWLEVSTNHRLPPLSSSGCR